MAVLVHGLVHKIRDLVYSGEMNNVCGPFEGKKITLMGLGLLGRGVGDAKFLAECGAEVLVTDMKTEMELAESVEVLKKYPNVTFHLGKHTMEDFTSCDMVIKAAGVALDSPFIVAARTAGVPVYMSTALFAKYAMEIGATIVGVTGTRGKSTVTQMIYWGLKETGSVNAFLGGNVRGVSTLTLLSEIKSGDIAVLELDSWQLQGFGDLKISPDISVFTNLMPDHQNYYKSEDDYFADKANIFLYQNATDVLICGEGIEQKIKAARPPLAPIVPESIPDEWQLQIPGAHNRDNASLATEVLRHFLEEEEIWASITSFAGVEGRLQLVSDKNGVKIYNDNNATTPEATIAALQALSVPRLRSGQNQNIVLILGGADKGLDMSNLLYEIAKSCKRVICLAGTGTSRITPFMQDYSIYDNLKSAVEEAIKSAQSGDIILFSPAFASFGMFKNEYERNDTFLKIIDSVTK